MDKPTADPLIGRTFSQYEVVARIGGGGMGVVYKAADLKLGRTVALKFLPPAWSHDDGAKQRFLREAQAASATNHRNICIIHDISQTDDGQLFIVMAHYEGQTLKQKLEGGVLPIGEALEIATEVAEGLAKAHAQGVVHRDVKPGNLIITEDGVKVLDFGLAKFADSLQLTMPGSTVGTVAYMSPEQARGEEADVRSDVWALGVVFYEMLTGRVPFSGAYPEATFHAIKNEPVPPLSASGREIPPAVDMLVMRALEKDPGRRYQSARELARDFRLLQGRTVPLDLRTEQLPPLPTSLYGYHDKVSWSQRIRRAVTPARAIAAILAVAAITAGTYAWLTRPVVRIPVAIAPVANHTGEPELDGYRLALTGALTEELGDSPNIRVVSYPRLLEIVRRFIGVGDVSSSEAIQAIATQSGASFVVMPSLEYRNATWLAQIQIRDVASGTVTDTYETDAMTSSLPKDTALRQIPLVAEKVQAHFKAIGPGRSYGSRAASARFRNLDALKAFEEGVNAYAELEYASALAAFRRAAGADEQQPIAQLWLSRVSLVLSQRDEAVAAAKRARLLVTADTPDADIASIDAMLAESQSDSEGAERRYRAMAGRRPDDVVAKIGLADFLKRQQRDQEAIAAYRDALRFDAQDGRPRVDVCQVYVRLNEYALAEEEAGAALKIFRAAGHRGGEAQALLCLGDAQRAQGGARLAEAKQSIESAGAIFESLGYEYGLSRVNFYFGLVAAGERDFPGAAKFFEEALSLSRTVGNRLIEGNALMNLGVTFEALGQRPVVLKYYQEARDFYQRNGDGRRAAEQEANAAMLLIDYGADQDLALRRLINARATFEKLGSIEFQVGAMEMEAASALHAGRHEEARRQLRAALNLARERQLGTRAVFTSIRLAESYFETAEYEQARVVLEETAATAAGRDELALPIALGRIHTRLGDVEGARRRLEPALRAVEAGGQLGLSPAAHLALGELEYETGRTQEARAHFDRAAAFWVDELPDAASVEAKCDRAALDPQFPTAAAAVGAGVNQARKMRRLYLEAQCRVQQARIHLFQGKPTEALATLGEIPLTGDRTLGREMPAWVHVWRSRALTARGDRMGAEAEAAQARGEMNELRASLPAAYRDGFAARIDVRQLLRD